MAFEGANMRKWSFAVALILVLGVFISALTILPDSAKASTLYVGGAGPGNYTTIQEAIDDANPGDIVYVYNGTYNETVTISKTLSLIGEDRSSTIIRDMQNVTVVSVESNWVNLSGFTVGGNGGMFGGFASLFIWRAQNCTISRSTIIGNWTGIGLIDANGTNIDGNTIHSFSAGIGVDDSHHITIVGNTIHSSEGISISIDDSNNTVIMDNTMIDGGLVVGGDTLAHWDSHHIDTSNTVNGGPVYYWRGMSDGSIPLDAGQVILANCTGVFVEHLSLLNGSHGIQLGFSSHNSILRNNASGNLNGLYLYKSSDNEILNNTFMDNRNGIYMRFSDRNVITGNLVSRNGWGIDLQYSDNNTMECNDFSWNGPSGVYLYYSIDNAILGNNVTHNTDGIFVQTHSDRNTIMWNVASENMNRGIYVFASRNNTIAGNMVSNNGIHGLSLVWSNYTSIYHNNLINNTDQAEDDSITNVWDDGYPSGGNYWSDYNGTDNCSGPNQDSCPDPDGIGDTPYTTDADSQDSYPLMEPLPLEAPPCGNQRPICEIVHPVEHERIHETFTITGTASDEDGTIAEVEIRIDNGSWIRVNETTSWSYDWDTTNVSNGEYTIYARSYDGEDYSDEVNVTVDVHNPTEEEMMYGEIFFWTAVVLVVVIAITGLLLEVKRRKKEES